MGGRREQRLKNGENPDRINGMTAGRREDEAGGARGEASVCPVLLDGEAPFPGEVVVLVVVGELGLDVVGAAGQQAFGGLLHGGEELVLLVRFGPVAADHVVRLVNCTEGTRSLRTGEDSSGREAGLLSSTFTVQTLIHGQHAGKLI